MYPLESGAHMESCAWHVMEEPRHEWLLMQQLQPPSTKETLSKELEVAEHLLLDQHNSTTSPKFHSNLLVRIC